jgi:hypothetical protein
MRKLSLDSRRSLRQRHPPRGAESSPRPPYAPAGPIFQFLSATAQGAQLAACPTPLRVVGSKSRLNPLPTSVPALLYLLPANHRRTVPVCSIFFQTAPRFMLSQRCPAQIPLMLSPQFPSFWLCQAGETRTDARFSPFAARSPEAADSESFAVIPHRLGSGTRTCLNV